MARDYRAIGETQAFSHFLTAIRMHREALVHSLINEEKDSGKWKEAIRLCDQLLLIPEKMVEDGCESGRQLAQLGRYTDE